MAGREGAYHLGVVTEPSHATALQSMRPVVMGYSHMVSAGHYLAAEAAFQILEAGGNAIDAGVAGGLALGVVQSDLVSIAGVAPMVIRLARTGEVVTIDGLGVWPRASSLDHLVEECGGVIPAGVLRTVVPAAPEAWITALGKYGTLSFGEVAAPAIRLARDGFPMHPLFAENIRTYAEGYRRWKQNAAIYLPKGRPPEVGELFIQRDIASSLAFMAAEERRARRKGGRMAGLKAARDAFYRGDIAKTMCDFYRREGGWLVREDLENYRVVIEKPVRARFQGVDIYTCGPWCQGPVLAQALAILDGYDLKGFRHNTTAYLHVVAEALKLAFADREHHYRDPRHARVPMAALVSAAYAEQRRALINPLRAWQEMPPAGEPHGRKRSRAALRLGEGTSPPPLDTSYVAVVDRHGNAFSATPSDTSFNAPVVPGLGFVPSSRGSQSWAQRGHPHAVAPGRRPRLTPNPALAVKKGDWLMPFGTPGGDVQCQAMLQAFLNVAVFGMDVQQAVEAARVASFSFPNSFEPHQYYPGRLNVEGAVGRETGNALAALGHEVEWWPERTWRAGAMCMVKLDMKTGLLSGGADPRRPAYALGW
jgi:gamma-glutamyltranspeptidase / glutathione hydrolase